MEWYSGDRVLKEQSQRTRFPLQERWKQWGDSHSLYGATDEVSFSCESLVDNVELYRPQFQMNHPEISCFQEEEGVLEESSLYWSTLLNNQDYQPYELSGTDQTDENFMNSLLIDDVRANEHFHLSNFTTSHGSFSTRNNLTSDMLLGSSSDLYSMHNVSSYEDLNAEDFGYSFVWDKNQSDATYYNCWDMMANATPPYNSSAVNVKAPPQPSVEETVLQELGNATQKMTEESRLCFRDALYRLASNSEKYSRNRGKDGYMHPSEMPLATGPPDLTKRSRESNACESNAIDRAVAELMFNKSYLNDKSVKPWSKNNNLKKWLAPHFQQFSGTTPDDAVVPTSIHNNWEY